MKALIPAALLVIVAPALYAQATFVLPAPTGPHAVGTTSWHVIDSSRAETFTSSPARREVRVTGWYPAATSTHRAGARAPYLRETLTEARAFASAIGSPGVFDNLASVETHSIVDDAIATGATRLPVLVFSHGYTGLTSAYTSLLEDLASHGYIVLSIAHTYEVVATTLANGVVVTMLDSAGAMRQGIKDVLNEWSDEDSTMARSTRTTSEDEKLRILRGYLGGIPKTVDAIDRWVKDTKLVLDDLPTRHALRTAGRLARRANMTRIGVFGHSMGGVVAGQFCVEDSRCRAGLNLDGIPQSGTMIDAKVKRPFLMVYSQRPGRLGASDPIYRRGASPYYRVDVDGARHADFSDMNFWGGPLKKFGIVGDIAPERAAEVTRLVVREYFDQELRGKASPWLAGKIKLPDARARLVR